MINIVNNYEINGDYINLESASPYNYMDDFEYQYIERIYGGDF